MSTSNPAYFSANENFALERSPSGVLTVRFHTESGPAVFTGTTHHDFPRLIEEIAYDRDNTVVVLTGTGDRFMTEIDGPSLGDLTKPMSADTIYVEGRRGVQRLVDLEIPIVAAVNGPVAVHSEYVLLADVIVASDTTVVSDYPHLAFGIAPGDGLFVVWEEAIGLNRARQLEITNGSFTAPQALEWGAVAEVVHSTTYSRALRRSPNRSPRCPSSRVGTWLSSSGSASAAAWPKAPRWEWPLRR